MDKIYQKRLIMQNSWESLGQETFEIKVKKILKVNQVITMAIIVKMGLAINNDKDDDKYL